MPWSPVPKVTIGSTVFTDKTLNGAVVTMGRQSFWEQPRAGNAQVQIINKDNTNIMK